MKPESDFTPANPTAVLDRAPFTAAVATIVMVVEKSNTIPILQHMKLLADAGSLILVGTDMDMQVRVRVEGDVDGRVETTLPAHMMKSICGAAPDCDRLSIAMLPAAEAEEASNRFVSTQAEAVFGKTRYTLPSLPPGDFPDMKEPDCTGWRFKLPGSTLWNAFDSVRNAVSTEETRYYLNGVFLHPFEDGGETVLRAVATDGHRLYVQRVIPLKGGIGMPGIIVPRKCVEVLHKLLGGKAAPKEVKVRLDETSFAVSWGNIEVRSKTVDGTFPDYGRVVPEKTGSPAVFLAKNFEKALKAVTVMSSERGRAVRLDMDQGTCTLAVSNPDAGQALSEMPCEYEGEARSIGFNSGYLRAVLTDAAPAGGYVTFRLPEEEAGPTIITGAHKGWFSVIMPMRV